MSPPDRLQAASSFWSPWRSLFIFGNGPKEQPPNALGSSSHLCRRHRFDHCSLSSARNRFYRRLSLHRRGDLAHVPRRLARPFSEPTGGLLREDGLPAPEIAETLRV